MQIAESKQSTNTVSQNGAAKRSLFFQPKLTINQPNDIYEQEADAMADKVMRMPDPAVNNNFFFKPAISSVQRKCAHCEEEEKKQLQRKEINSEITDTKQKSTTNQHIDVYTQQTDARVDKVIRMQEPSSLLSSNKAFFSPTTVSINKPITAKEDPLKKENKEEETKETWPEIQAKLSFDGLPTPPDDTKANNDSLIQRKCAHCEEEELQKKEYKKEKPVKRQQPEQPVQAKFKAFEEEEKNKLHRKESGDTGQVAPGNVDQALQSSVQQMDSKTLDFMENRFGYDFGNVQIHNDKQAHQSSADINALAYTHQNHIVFGEGQYQPNTDRGKQLLAHELTHVVQQTDSINKKVIQKKNYFFAPPNKPSGTLVHSAVLPLFIKANSDLFIEVKIPGANKKDVDKGVTGIADFYKATPSGGNSRTIGINYDGTNPSFLSSNSKLEFGGGRYSHKTNAAPQGSLITPKVTKLTVAPTDIYIGDLKPGFSSETFLGEGQVTDYKSGIKNTATYINNYLSVNPDEGDSKTKWNPDPKSLSSLNIPSGVQYPGGAEFPRVPLSLYEEGLLGVKRVLEDTSLKGRLFVYKDKVNGVWSYEWIPDNIPTNTGSGQVNTVLERLNGDVIPSITAAGSGGVAPKLINKKSLPVKKQTKKIVQKTDKNFNDESWKKKHFTPWQDDAKKFLGNDKEVEKTQVAKTLVDVEERSGTGIGIPSEVKDRGKGLDKVKHWNRFGGLYSWLREKFDFVYVKLQAFGKRVKDKIAKLSKSSAVVKFGNWVKAAAQVIFKIFKMVGAWVVNQVIDKLVNSFREGVMKNLKKLVDMYTPENVKSKIEEFEAMKEKYEQIINEEEEVLIKKFFGDKLELFEKLSEFEAIADTLTTIVSLVEWGIRLLACASPPAIGCLWNLFIEALQVAFALLMQTCWFTKKVYKPVIDLVEPVKKFPAEVASKIVDVANEYIPMPEGFDPIFAPINVDANEFIVDCDGKGDGAGKLTPERQAILDLLDAIGKEKFDALIQLMLKRGAGPWVLLTPERLTSVKDDLMKANIDDLRKIAEGEKPAEGFSVSMEKLLTDIAKYTPREEKVKKDYFDEKKKREAAERAKADAAGAGGGKPSAVGASGSGDGGGKAGPVKTMGEKATNTSTTQYVQFGANIYAPAFSAANIPKESVKITLFVFYKDNPTDAKGEYYYVADVKVKVKNFDGSMYTFVNEEDFSVEYKSGTKHFFKKNLELHIETKFVKFK
ncbi:MAG: DUF4157 domain-containing protein [Ginsengibacter sp.]